MTVYIIENDKPHLLYKIFNVFKLENIENKTIIRIPINSRSLKFRIEQNAKKLSEFLYNNDVRNIVLSKELMKMEEFKNILYSNNINILDGTRLSRYLTYEIILKILKYKTIKIETAEITILVNNNDNVNIENIIRIGKKVKRLNILTNNVKAFKKIVDYLYEEVGILVKLTNNININLKNTDVILNIDFPEELINKIELPLYSTIISIPYNVDINLKKFSGINIKAWDIITPSEYKLSGFEDRIIYESIIYNKDIENIYKKIKEDNIKIINLRGKNGIINRKEFARNL